MKTPGCYLMKDKNGQIIYVGKAKNLKSRVSSYFNSSKDHSVKTRALVREIHDFDLMYAKTELEALLLERTLIKHHKPHYNILLRDDKEYPFIKVNFNETWPRVEKVRKRLDDGANYIGPFANPGQLHTLMKTIFRIFPLIRCSRYEFDNAKRPCNYYHMKMCLGPCVLEVDRTLYLGIVKRAIMILQGKNKDLLKATKKEMMIAASKEEFELAASLRDQMFALEKMIERQIAVVQKTIEADIFIYLVKDHHIVFHVTQVRDFRVLGSENFMLPLPAGNIEDSLSTFLLQYYDNKYIPDLLITDKEFSERVELSHLLSDEKKAPMKISIAKGKEEKDLIHFAFDNAANFYKQQIEIKSRSKVELEMLRDTLSLAEVPKRMECIDISNTGETAVVASNVCFIDGKPAKQFYRKYNVKTLDGGQDDFASMREVVERRIERALRDGDMPDLLVIDGGKGQLSAALDAKKKFKNLEMNIVSLAKARTQKFAIDVKTPRLRSEERIFVPGRKDPIYLKEGSPVFRLMSQIRDEAHRFAISFHRKKRQASSMSSVLDDISGVGPILKTRLLKEFDGLAGLKKASLDQLKSIKGVSDKVAVAIHGAMKDSD